MDSKMMARIEAVAFVAIALTMTALGSREAPTVTTESLIVPPSESEEGPLQAELRRCQALGANGANDTRCLHAWAEQRSRFFLSLQGAAEAWRDDAGNPFPDDSGNAALPDILPLTNGADATAAPSGGGN